MKILVKYCNFWTFYMVTSTLLLRTHVMGSVCDIDPCPTGSVCEMTAHEDYECVCYPGFIREGPYCNDRNECLVQDICHNGTCVNTPGSFHCACSEGYTGSRCNHVIDPCQVTPCQNGGTCTVNADGMPLCHCYPGFDQNNYCADRDECQTAGICHNGTCANTVGSFTCSCHLGYKGQRCTEDVDECQYKPCEDEMFCTNTMGNYSCDCYPGYLMPDCRDRDECSMADNLCQNGTCVNTPGSYHCACDTGYSGQHCRVDINECERQPCLHGACINTLGSYSCMCNTGFTGQNCDSDVTPTPPHPTPTVVRPSPTTPAVTPTRGISTAQSTVRSSKPHTSQRPSSTRTIRVSTILNTLTTQRVASRPTTALSRPTETSAMPATRKPSIITTVTTYGNGDEGQLAKDGGIVPWIQDHLWIVIVAGVTLIVGVTSVVVIVIRKRKQTEGFKYKHFTSQSAKTLTKEKPTETSMTTENPLYIAFSADERGSSEL